MTIRFVLTVCATMALTSPALAEATAPAVPPPGAVPAALDTPGDLFEPLNRAVFQFNNTLVAWVIDPLADVLSRVTPTVVQTMGTNVYNNISEPEYFFTNFLAGYRKDAGVSLGRLLVNTTLGVGGLFDVATPMGFKRRPTEVSEAMCRAGVSPGPYVVLPVIGPTNLFSGGILGGLLATEWYVLSLVSTALAAGDAVFDISVSAASLRHVRELPGGEDADLYAVQQRVFWDSIKSDCDLTPRPVSLPITSTGLAGPEAGNG
jgi:phospholipid-binding lipoprotein MlaA